MRNDELQHFGVLGMRWGKRKSQTEIMAEKDKKWERDTPNLHNAIKVYNRAADRMNATEIKRINAKPEYGPGKLDDPEVNKKYLKEYADVFTKALREESAAVFGTNPSGTKRVVASSNEYGQVTFDFEEITHSSDTPRIRFIGYTNEFGQIISIRLAEEEPEVQHSVTYFGTRKRVLIRNDELQHFGVLGMKWGRRKAAGSSSGANSLKSNTRDYHDKLGAVNSTARSHAQAKMDLKRNPKDPDLQRKELETRQAKDKALSDYNNLMNRPKPTHDSVSGEPLGLIPKMLGRDKNFRLGKRKGESDADYDKRLDAEIKKDDEDWNNNMSKVEAASAAHKQAKAELKKNPKDIDLQDKEFLAKKALDKANKDFDDFIYNDNPAPRPATKANRALQNMRDVRNMKPSEREVHYEILRSKELPKAARWAEATFREKVNWTVGMGDPKYSTGKKVARTALATLALVAINADRLNL